MKTGRISKRTALLALHLVLAASLPARAEPELARGPVLILWSAGDCGPCKAWSQTERRTEFLAEARRLGVPLVVVERPRVADPVSLYRWPRAAAELAEAYQHYPPASMTPAFDFVCRGEMQKRLDGLADWDSFWKRTLRDLATRCKAPAA